MKIEDITKEWETDCKIDDKNLDKSSCNTPQLHSKYINFLMEAKLKLAREQKEYNKLKKLKFRYYRGELTQQELIDHNWEQYQYRRPLKNEMEEILRGDDDLIKGELKLDYLGSMVYLLESILGSVKQRDWGIKNIIEWKKFLVGN